MDLECMVAQPSGIVDLLPEGSQITVLSWPRPTCYSEITHRVYRGPILPQFLVYFPESFIVRCACVTKHTCSCVAF